ncbi:hypothetical protein N8I77_006350 [Diaporthe amygdali]|uniref:Uncharacterized protein n=1 Tax=Phomopsis amygdali TaxID=1214568 RepID=A0AAD9W4E2_PHOAM|nr:hypothetical protein N8I77_006350 [Diaporthe amygdali]
MSSVEVAGLAGTWVAAGLAFLGIFAIVGPLLVWWASRSERHQALMKIGLKNNGYLSRGLTVWPGIRFFQIERVPRLKKVTLFKVHEWRDFDLSKLKSIPESTVPWVQFGACLEAYGLKIQRGKELDTIEIEETKVLCLPVHKAYLFTFLVMGRYQRKLFQANPIKPVASDSMSCIALPARTQTILNRYRGTHLYGTTGSFTFHEGYDTGATGVLSFVTSLEQCQTRLVADRLSWSSIVLLALGYLPLPSGHYLSFAITDNNGAFGMISVPQFGGAPSIISLDSDSVVESESSHSSATDVSHPNKFHRQVQVDQKNLQRFRLEVYRLQTQEKRLRDLPIDLGDPDQKIRARVLKIISSAELSAVQGHLQGLAAMTFVPPQEEYVRVFKQSARKANSRNRDCVFITRASAQLFALGILHLPWSQNNYIVGRVLESNIVRNLLFEAAPACIRFLLRLQRMPSILRLSQTREDNFLEAAKKVLKPDEDIPGLYKPELSGLYELDEILSSMQHRTMEVSLMIGVLVLTNTEYRELIYQSVRQVSSTTSNLPKVDTEMDFEKGHVTVPGAFGIEHIFMVDLDCLLEDLPNHQRSQSRTIKVDFATVLLAALKAYIRSLMLENCIDGRDIEHVMRRNGDVYRVL